MECWHVNGVGVIMSVGDEREIRSNRQRRKINSASSAESAMPHSRPGNVAPVIGDLCQRPHRCLAFVCNAGNHFKPSGDTQMIKNAVSTALANAKMHHVWQTGVLPSHRARPTINGTMDSPLSRWIPYVQRAAESVGRRWERVAGGISTSITITRRERCVEHCVAHATMASASSRTTPISCGRPLHISNGM